MKFSLNSPEEVKSLVQAIDQPPAATFCSNHGFDCNRYAVNCCMNVARASYKTYALVYIFQLISNRKKFRQKQCFLNESPGKQIPKFLWNYLKSVSFTAIDFLIMRKVMCLYHKYVGANASSLIVGNFVGGLYLAVESRNRQIEVALYCINKTTQTVFNSFKRRHPKFKIPQGQALLFAFSMAIMCYYYFNNRELFRPAYEKAFNTILKNV